MAAGHGMFVFLFRKLFFLYLEGLLLFLRRFPFFVERLDLPHQFQRWNKRDCQLWNFQSQLKWSQDNVVAEKNRKNENMKETWQLDGDVFSKLQVWKLIHHKSPVFAWICHKSNSNTTILYWDLCCNRLRTGAELSTSFKSIMWHPIILFIVFAFI